MRPLELSRYLIKNDTGGYEYDQKKLKKIFDKPKLDKITKNHKISSNCAVCKIIKFDKNTDKDISEENYIIIGSSCVNPAAEHVMRCLYKENKRILSRTIRKYKSRSLYSQCILNDSPIICRYCKKCEYKSTNCPHQNKHKISKEKKNKIINNRTGIFIKNKKTTRYGYRELQIDSNKPKKETALLIICSRHYISPNQPGEAIVLSGFGKYGTFELSRVLSRVNTEDDYSENYKDITIRCNPNWECGCELKIEDFFAVINSIRREKKPYCIEAIFEFNFCTERESSTELTENNSMKLKQSLLKWFCLFDPEKRDEEDLFKRLRGKMININ
jgi:hypothetical protein